MAFQAAVTEDEESVRVTHWRVQRFLELGFTVRQARLLAAAQADWHGASVFLAAGCELETAFRLLV